MNAFECKEYIPELLFTDKKILDNIQNHPMAIWKTEQPALHQDIEISEKQIETGNVKDAKKALSEMKTKYRL